jgi:hypothetical protein
MAETCPPDLHRREHLRNRDGPQRDQIDKWTPELQPRSEGQNRLSRALWSIYPVFR